MSILKIGILVAVVVAVLPADRAQQAALYDRAASAVHWTATFCDRNGPTCDQASIVWAGFVKKAQFGAAMAYELAMKQAGASQSRSLDRADSRPDAARHAARRGPGAGLARLFARRHLSPNTSPRHDKGRRSQRRLLRIYRAATYVNSVRSQESRADVTKISDISADFALLDDWEDRYRYVIELGRTLAPLPDALRTDANKVRGCASQVWLSTQIKPGRRRARVHLPRRQRRPHRARPHRHPRPPSTTAAASKKCWPSNPDPVFGDLGLKEHLTPQRSNGLASMVARIRADAAAANAHAPPVADTVSSDLTPAPRTAGDSRRCPSGAPCARPSRVAAALSNP